MKNLILGFLLIFPYISQSQTTIKDFYEIFKHEERKPSQNSETNKVFIDEKNAFIKIENPKDADDAISFKCFTKNDQSKVFGFQYSASQPALGIFMTRTEFYVYQNNEWKNVTEQVCPNIGFKDFWGSQPLPERSLNEFNLHLILPQTGTTILAKSAPATKEQFVYGNLPKEYMKTFEKRKFKVIELKWNKATGKFDIGKRY
ncbi:MAG: hypothetical protein MUC49_02035 [Raineya sp.]|jgi:hypothetical protein|nr:hypothetical protein [Raineya sp.]